MRKSGIALLGLGLAVAAGLTQQAQAQYCSVSTGYNAQCTTTWEFINNVTLGDLNDTRLCSTVSYEDNSSLSATMTQGQSLPISITVGSYWGDDYVTVYVDWDNNGILDDPGEAFIVATGGGTETGTSGPHTFNTTNITVPPTATIGMHRMRVWLVFDSAPGACRTDVTYGQVKDYSINVVSSDNPLIAGNPVSGTVGDQILLTAQITPGQNPPSTSLTVTGDLTSIGGASSQTFYDDGSHGDASPGDHVFSYLASVPHGPAQAAGTFSVPATVVDNLSRSTASSIAVTLAAEPLGGCCTGGACAVATAFNCAGGGGHYQGNGTNCGTPSYAISDSANPFTSIVGNGGIMTGTSSNIDDGVELLALPFSFQFFDNSYTSLYVCSNGNLQFGDAPSTAWNNDAIPTAAVPNNAIYPLWDDLNTVTGGDIYYSTAGVSPNRTFTVEWNNVSQYTGIGGGVTSENFQVVLFETSNNIELRYGNISAPCNTGADQCLSQGSDGDDRTVGVENIDGTVAYSIGGATLGTGNLSKLMTYTLPSTCGPSCGTADFNCDGDVGTDQDIAGFFACLSGSCPSAPCTNSADFNGDGDVGTDQDIDAFFRVLSGGHC